MWLRTGFDSGSDKKNHRTETTVDTEGRNRIGFKRELFVYRLAYNDDIVAFKNGPPARRSEPDYEIHRDHRVLRASSLPCWQANVQC
jgi:hypothetical protein